MPDSEVTRVLCVAAHPDDLDFALAGTVALWTDKGIEVSYVICTDGQAGGFDLETPRDQVADIRRSEQLEAAAIVGVEDVRFLGGMDGELGVTPGLVHDITAAIRRARPERVVIPSPERDWQRIGRSQPDHLAAGEAAIRAIYPAARNPFAFPALFDQGLEPWTIAETWVMAHPTSNHVVDVTDTFDRLLKAILAHRSQHLEPHTIEDRMRGFLGARGEAAGMPGRLVEAFFVTATG